MTACLATALLVLGGGAPFVPQVASLTPAGGQRGTEVEVLFAGQRLSDPLDLVCTKPGLEVVAIASDKPERCKVTLRVAADCALGAHPLRLRTAHGLSNMVLFHVGVLPEVTRTKDTDPQPISLGSTVNGWLADDAVDRCTVAVEAGVRVQCEVEAFRLGFGPIDLAMTATDPAGHEFATCDDSALGHKDPILSFTATTAGTYGIEVRAAFADAANRGAYRLHVGTFPRPTAALPCGGAPGETLALELLGDGPSRQGTVTLPDEPDRIWKYFAADASGTAPTPIYLRIGGPPNQQPVPDDKGRTLVTFPASVHGVLAQPGASARFFFRAEKGEELLFRVIARSLRSPLDPLLVLRQPDGRYLAANDDQAGLGMDCLLRFKAAETGDYQAEVRDVLRQGSSAHVFRLEGERPSEAMSLRLSVGRREEAVLNVPAGARMGGVLQVSGANPATELELVARNLPAGVSARFGPVRRGINLVPILLTADAQAPLQHALIEFGTRAGDAQPEQQVRFAQIVPLVTVRNDQPILNTAQLALPIAVTRALPFVVEVAPPTVPIVRNAPLALAVRVRRADGNKDRIRVRALWTPPGVNAGQVVLEPGQDEVVIPLSASNSAMLGEFPVAVVGTVYTRGDRFESASDFVPLRVDEPWVTSKLEPARTEQGTPTELRASLTVRRPVAGAIKARLLGLPRGVTAAELHLEPTATTAVFALQVGKDATCGRHRNVVLEVSAPSGGGDVVCRGSGGELRIDAPLVTGGGSSGGGQ